MGKKRIIKTTKSSGAGKEAGDKAQAKLPRKKLVSGVLHIQSTYNNVLMSLSDTNGNAVMWSTSGSLGFKGAKKGTPFAASKVAEFLIDKAKTIGLVDVDVVLNGVGAGREAAIRSVAAKGVRINLIRDITPVPHNGPRAPRARRV